MIKLKLYCLEKMAIGIVWMCWACIFVYALFSLTIGICMFYERVEARDRREYRQIA